MLIKDLVEVLATKEISGDLEQEIRGISYDSRQVKQGDIFVAIKGFETDGHKFITEAVDKGAIGVIVERDLSEKLNIAVIKTTDTREALAKISRHFYDYADQDLKIVGVTGTNGKTTTTFLIELMLEKLVGKTGLIGTIKNKIGKREEASSRTTPESLDLQRLFKAMKEEGIEYVTMEVSSHALELKRVLGIDFSRQVFTNLSQEHLDFHKSLADYLAIKARLFKLNQQPSIINIDDEHGLKIKSEAQGEVITYGLSAEADFRASQIEIDFRGTSYLLEVDDKQYQVKLNLAGKFNVYNSLAAIATLSSLDFELEDIIAALAEIKGVPGRFELIDQGQNFGVIVDYAHTPDGMKNVLETAQEIAEGKIIVVFGCGGDRDTKKRPIMGQLGVELADFAIVTSDNPRSEEPQEIIKDIKVGIDQLDKIEAEDYIIIENRGEAINQAVSLAAKDDLVLIIGKGHETYQILKDKTIDFDDRKVARDALNNRSEK